MEVDVGESGGSGLDPAGFRIGSLKLLHDVVSDESAIVIGSRPPDVGGCVLDIFHDRRAGRVRTVVDGDLKRRNDNN